jgi:hypothetical protein
MLEISQMKIATTLITAIQTKFWLGKRIELSTPN